MTEVTRQKIIDTLMYGCPGELTALVEMCAEDADRLAPIIDDLERQAELRGRFQALLQQLDTWGKVLARAQTKPLTREAKSIY